MTPSNIAQTKVSILSNPERLNENNSRHPITAGQSLLEDRPSKRIKFDSKQSLKNDDERNHVNS